MAAASSRKFSFRGTQGAGAFSIRRRNERGRVLFIGRSDAATAPRLHLGISSGPSQSPRWGRLFRGARSTTEAALLPIFSMCLDFCARAGAVLDGFPQICQLRVPLIGERFSLYAQRLTFGDSKLGAREQWIDHRQAVLQRLSSGPVLGYVRFSIVDPVSAFLFGKGLMGFSARKRIRHWIIEEFERVLD